MVDINSIPSELVQIPDVLWNDNETKLLLSVIVEKDILKLFKNKKYKREDVLKMIENEFQKYGITNKNTQLIDNKWKDLIKMYKHTIKTNIAIGSRGGIPLTCYYYDELDRILAPQTTTPNAINPINVKNTPATVQQPKIVKTESHKYGEIFYIDGQLKYCCFICQNIEENAQEFEEHFYSKHFNDLNNCNSLRSSGDNLFEKPIETFAFEVIEIKQEFKDCPEIISTQNDDCEIVVTDPNNLVINDTQPDVFNCDLCSMDFKTKTKMKNHTRHCVECNLTICGRKKYYQHNYKYHKKKIEPTRTYICYICKISLKSTTNLKIHLRLHTGEKPYICTDCDKAFTIKSSLTMHIHHYHHSFERKFMCAECGKCFAFQRFLNKHVKRHRRQEENPLPCPICMKVLANSEQLRIHLKIHTNERNFICNVCDKSFKTSTVYKQHMQIHSDKRMFPCRFCDLSFSQSAGRRGHVRRVHEGIK